MKIVNVYNNNMDEIEFVCQSNEARGNNNKILDEGRMHAIYTFTQFTRTEYCSFVVESRAFKRVSCCLDGQESNGWQ